MKYSKPSVTVANTEKLNPRGTCSNSFSCGGWFDSFSCDSKHSCSGRNFSCKNYNSVRVRSERLIL